MPEPEAQAPTPLVAVVVPVCNGFRFLAETLRHAAGQTRPPLEVIVVDNADNDDSAAVAMESGIHLHCVRMPGTGVSRTRTGGVAAARGDLVCFLETNDLWHPQRLKRQLHVCARHPEAGAVVSPCQHWCPGTDGYANTAQPWLRLSCSTPFVPQTWPPVLYRQHPSQGFRTARQQDYRCELLADASAHGLASRDGRAVPAAEFQSTLARYPMDFGLGHGQSGSRVLGVRSLPRAWLRRPRAWRCQALPGAGPAAPDRMAAAPSAVPAQPAALTLPTR